MTKKEGEEKGEPIARENGKIEKRICNTMSELYSWYEEEIQKAQDRKLWAFEAAEEKFNWELEYMEWTFRRKRREFEIYGDDWRYEEEEEI